MAGALRWVQRGERERLVALLLPGPVICLGSGHWQLVLGSQRPKAEGRAPFSLQAQVLGNGG